MALIPNASRTVTPAMLSSNCNCDENNSLKWPNKTSSSTLDYWIDASKEIDNNATVSLWAYDVYYGDNKLNIVAQIQDGYKCGLILSNGTAGVVYAVRFTAILSDNRILTWDVALPIINDMAATPITNTVTFRNVTLRYAGETLPVVNGV